MRVAIIGLGLIGGSIALGLKQANPEINIVGVTPRQETIDEALSRQAIDEGTTDLCRGVADADIVFLCPPLNLIVPTLKKIAQSLKSGAIVTDVGSSKTEIVAQAAKVTPQEVHFIGGHPLAGKEQTKFAAAEANLFQNRVWVLTPTAKTSRPATIILTQLIKLLEARVIEMKTDEHDIAVAGISHTPLAIAAALVNSVAAEKKSQANMKQLAASGFRDTTRVASGDPELGRDMFTTNKKAVLKTLANFKKSLTQLETAIKKGNTTKIKQLLAQAKKFRDEVYV
ncbi:prephenate dehydrogenase/arogenate dehydrogenase family protein [Candidatus Saganbacteria bacterium]|nr:prephenate dehydrogenase/arogenate dehydrogenase family protein [Candidatus Saganbacteria bacterium]